MTAIIDNLSNARVTLRDVTTLESQDFGKCANCYENVDDDSACKTFQDEIAILSLFHIKVVDALADIFELHKKLYLSSVRLDENDLVLCFRCTNTLKKLYSFFVEFINSSNSPSFMNSVLKFSPTFSRIKIFRNIESTEIEDPEDTFDTNIKLELVSFEGDSVSDFLDDDICEENEIEVSSKGRPRVDHTSLVEVEYESDDFSDVDIPDDLNTDPDYVQVGHLLQISESEDSDEDNARPRSSASTADELKDDVEGYLQSAITRKKEAEGHEAVVKIKRKRDRTTKRYKCDICSEKFSRTDHVKRHMRCHSETNFTCSICSAGFKHQLRMEEHVKTHDPNYVPPPKPPKKVPAQSGVDGEGKPVHSKPKKHIKGFTECEICGKVLPNRHNINLHLASHKGEADKTLVCEICGSTFKTNSALKTHQKFHENIRDFLCKVCGVSFKRRQHLAEHEAVKHGNQPRQFVCSEPNCNKAFHRLRNLRQHRKLHGNTKYACENGCGALFTFKYNRKVHQDKSCSKAPHLMKINEERRAKYSKTLPDSAGSGVTSVEKPPKRRGKAISYDGGNQSNQANTETETAFTQDPNLPSNSNSDNPINFSHCSLQHFSRNPSNFPFNFSSSMFPLGMSRLDCLNLPQPSSSSPCDPPQHQLQFPAPYDRDKVSVNSSISSSFINTMNRPMNDIQSNDFSYN